jgi:hypothetical protein
MYQVTSLLKPVLISLPLFLFSCQSGNNKSTEDMTDSSITDLPARDTPPITLVPVQGSPEFSNAQLAISKVSDSLVGDSVKVRFEFEVKNYELKNQTPDAPNKQCNNSDKGQHIHFIMDNKPYVALYEPRHEVMLNKDSEHYLMAFLSRSYHESLKNKSASVVYHFKIDNKGKMQKTDNPKTPMIFYSRPKGDYLGKDVQNVLLDFYVWNGTVGKDFNVKADIKATGKDTSFRITEWKPYFLQNLPMGKTTITLSLVDSSGKLMQGPNTTGSRDINLSKDEPMKK